MVNYNNSKIYKICCRDTEIKDIYIGSTTNFTKRKQRHKYNCNCINPISKTHNLKVYQFIRDNGGWENWDMVLVEDVPCETKLQLHKIERKYIEENNSTLNCSIPTRTHKEYRFDNKQKIKEYHKKYGQINQQNREKLMKEIIKYREQVREEEWKNFIKQFENKK